jgi:hypothetical protein
MSIPVSLEGLRDEIDRATASPYLVTVGVDGRPHCVNVTVGWEADVLVADVGNTTIANATARPLVSLVWAPGQPGGHSLIVDATATVGVGPARRVVLAPTSAVLHRGVPSSGSTGEPDCQPVFRS